jgi:hypothetical protein
VTVLASGYRFRGVEGTYSCWPDKAAGVLLFWPFWRLWKGSRSGFAYLRSGISSSLKLVDILSMSDRVFFLRVPLVAWWVGLDWWQILSVTLFSAVPLITSMATLLFPVETKVFSSSIFLHLSCSLFFKSQIVFLLCLFLESSCSAFLHHGCHCRDYGWLMTYNLKSQLLRIMWGCENFYLFFTSFDIC